METLFVWAEPSSVAHGVTGYNIILHSKPVDEKLLTVVLANFSRIPTTSL